MPKMDTYKHLDKDTAMTVELSMEEIANRCVALNYGTHRLLSALVHALRAKNVRMAGEYAERHKDEPKRQGVEGPYEKCELADGIEALLDKGLY